MCVVNTSVRNALICRQHSNQAGNGEVNFSFSESHYTERMKVEKPPEGDTKSRRKSHHAYERHQAKNE